MGTGWDDTQSPYFIHMKTKQNKTKVTGACELAENVADQRCLAKGVHHLNEPQEMSLKGDFGSCFNIFALLLNCTEARNH